MNYQYPGQEEEGRSKRELILEAAYDVFSRKGYHRATIDEIIALADTGKGTVYNYFVNKEQLFYTLISEKNASFETAMTELADSSEEPLRKVEDAIRLFLRFYVRNGNLWRVLMHEMRGFGAEGASNLKPELREKYRVTLHGTIGQLAAVLREGVQQGVLRTCDVDKAALGLYSAIVAMVFLNQVSDDIDVTARSIADMFLYGIAKQS